MPARDKQHSKELVLQQNDALAVEGLDLIESDFGNASDGELKTYSNSTDNDLLRNYIKQISKFPMLSQEDEKKLLKEYLQFNNQKAGQAIILSHLRLVVKIAMQYKRYGMNMMDVIAEGNTGLMHALKKFDVKKQNRFSVYAGLWIKSFIQDFILRSWSLVKIGSATLRKQLLFNSNNIKKAIGVSCGEHNEQSVDEKMSSELGVSKKELVEARENIRQRDIMLDAPVGDDTGATLLDTIDDQSKDGNFVCGFENDEDENYRKKIFHESLSILNDRQREVIMMRFLTEPHATLEEVSKKLNVSKERARQIESEAIKKLQKFAMQYDN